MPNEAVAIQKVYPGVHYSVREPIVKSVAAADGAVTIYDRNAGERNLAKIEVQNIGTGALLIAFNQDAGDNAFHKLLAGGVASRDGLGSNYIIEPEWSINKVSVKAIADTEIAVTVFLKDW